MRERRIPLFTVESLSPVRDFHLIGFSLQSELNYTNIPNMLALAGIPVLARDRAAADPIVVGGGPCVANPEPLADFFDAFLIGDAEEALGELADALIAARAAGASREETLLSIARIPGWYVPQFYDCSWNDDGTIRAFTPNRPGLPERVSRRWVEKLSPTSTPTSRWCRRSRSSRSGSASRSCGAAPRGAASARPATGTGRCGSSTRTTSPG